MSDIQLASRCSKRELYFLSDSDRNIFSFTEMRLLKSPGDLTYS